MDMKSVLAAVERMFPSANLNRAVQTAEQAISGTENNLSGVSAAARNLGLNAQTVQDIYDKYGQTMQARWLCQMMGTTPEALKADADRIVGGSVGGHSAGLPAGPVQAKFPRLR